VVQGVGPEFKPQHRKKKETNKQTKPSQPKIALGYESSLEQPVLHRLWTTSAKVPPVSLTLCDLSKSYFPL
jgi:hypothetical protein